MDKHNPDPRPFPRIPDQGNMYAFGGLNGFGMKDEVDIAKVRSALARKPRISRLVNENVD